MLWLVSSMALLCIQLCFDSSSHCTAFTPVVTAQCAITTWGGIADQLPDTLAAHLTYTACMYSKCIAMLFCYHSCAEVA